MRIEVWGRVNEIAASEPSKVYLRLTPDNDSQGEVVLRVEQPHHSVSVEGLAIGQRLRITAELVD